MPKSPTSIILVHPSWPWAAADWEMENPRVRKSLLGKAAKILGHLAHDPRPIYIVGPVLRCLSSMPDATKDHLETILGRAAATENGQNADNLHAAGAALAQRIARENPDAQVGVAGFWHDRCVSLVLGGAREHHRKTHAHRPLTLLSPAAIELHGSRYREPNPLRRRLGA